MNKINPKLTDALICLVSVLSPLIVGLLKIDTLGQSSNNVMPIIGIVVGVPLVAIIGLSNSSLRRKSPEANRISRLGYLVPALLICLLIIFVDYDVVF